MRSGFRPHDRDRTTESMEGVWMGSCAVVKRVWAAKREGFQATRLTIGVSNDLQMARNLTGGLPVVYQGRLASLGPIREHLTLAHEKRRKGTPEDIGVPECKTDNGENARMHKTNMYANAMHMMT